MMRLTPRGFLSPLFCGALVFSAAACGDDAPITISVEEPDDTGNDLEIDGVYVIEEGQTLDLIVSSSGGSLTSANLPANAAFQNGIFSFSPSYSQSGVYSVDFQDEISGTVVVRTIGIRVNNVVYMPDVVAEVEEDGSATVTFSSDDPAGTELRYSSSLDANPIPGASLNKLTGELTFAPDYLYLDNAANPTEITIKAHTVEVDSGIARVAESVVLFDVEEKSSFQLEVLPIFPSCTQDGTGCHFTTAPSAGLDLSPDSAFNSIVSMAPGDAGNCGSATESHYIAPGDLGNSLLYQKVIGGQSCGQQMPFNCENLQSIDCLNETQLRKLQLWITGGALDN